MCIICGEYLHNMGIIYTIKIQKKWKSGTRLHQSSHSWCFQHAGYRINNEKLSHAMLLYAGQT